MHLSYSFHFDNSCLDISFHGDLFGYGTLLDGFFKLDLDNDSFAFVSSSSNLCDGSIKWHARLGHIGQERMNRLAQEGLMGSLVKVDLSMRQPCLAGKACIKPFGKDICATHSLELIHSDIVG